MFLCLLKEWYSDVPYNIRYISFMVQPLGGFWYIYIYIHRFEWSNLEPKQQLQQKRQQNTCLHANARLGHLFTLTKGPTKLPPKLYMATVRVPTFRTGILI